LCNRCRPLSLSPSSAKDKAGGSFEAPGQGSQSVRPGHCRSCLTKLSGYSGLYAVRSPQARCDACAHLGNLYDISEDHLHAHYSRPPGGDMFTHYLPQSELGPVGEGDGLVSHLEPSPSSPSPLLGSPSAPHLLLSRQHSYEKALPDGVPERQSQLHAHLRGLSLPDRDREREPTLDEGAYANVLTMRSDRPFGSRSPPSPSHRHSVDAAPMPLPRRSKSLFPDRPSHNPFVQSAPGTAQRDPSPQAAARLPQRSSAHELYKQRMPLSLTLGNHGSHHHHNQHGGLADQQLFYPQQEPPAVAYMVPPAASQPMGYVTAPRASSAGGNRPRLYRRMPSIESDV